MRRGGHSRQSHPCRGQPSDRTCVRGGVQRADVEVVELEVDELCCDLGERDDDGRPQPDC